MTLDAIETRINFIKATRQLDVGDKLDFPHGWNLKKVKRIIGIEQEPFTVKKRFKYPINTKGNYTLIRVK
jgi:hypothetical protein